MSSFVARTSIPDEYNDKRYRTVASGGYNRCIEGNSSVTPHVSGSVLANCVGYSWGRFCEVIGANTCSLSTGDAGVWFYNEIDGYERGYEPKLGAICCFNGHVCNVEEIIDEDTILTSNSNWTGPKFAMWTRTRDRGWNTAVGTQTFQGFIYPPIDFTSKGISTLIPLLIGSRGNTGGTILI